MERYKALVTDIDGTLTQVAPNSLPTKTVAESIKPALQSGYTISLATGRPFDLVQNITEQLGDMGPSIVDNGAVIVDSKNGKVLWQALLPYERAETLLGMIQEFPLFRVSCEAEWYENPTKIPNTAKIRKLSVHDITMEQAETLISNIEREFKDIALVKASSYKSDKLIDLYLTNSGATKQHAVLKLAEILGISTHEMIGIVDGYNDFPLLMACGLRIAMGNAVEELKSIAHEIAPPVEENGLAFIIDKYLA